jgi:YkoY family integral membrane protein
MIEKMFDFLPDLGNSSPILLLVLVSLEAVLSADNAVALASISQGLPDEKMRRQALNIGLIIAYILRMVLIIGATWVVNYWQFQILGAGYLLWLVFQYFSSKHGDDEEENKEPKFANIWQAIPMLAITDLAFSLDSVATAVAVSTDTWLVISGATIGIIILRFMAGLFIRWLKEYTYLEDAGYITVGLVGLKLLVRAVRPELEVPELLVVGTIAVIFAWGFSRRNDTIIDGEDATAEKLPEAGES